MGAETDFGPVVDLVGQLRGDIHGLGSRIDTLNTQLSQVSTDHTQRITAVEKDVGHLEGRMKAVEDKQVDHGAAIGDLFDRQVKDEGEQQAMETEAKKRADAATVKRSNRQLAFNAAVVLCASGVGAVLGHFIH